MYGWYGWPTTPKPTPEIPESSKIVILYCNKCACHYTSDTCPTHGTEDMVKSHLGDK